MRAAGQRGVVDLCSNELNPAHLPRPDRRKFRGAIVRPSQCLRQAPRLSSMKTTDQAGKRRALLGPRGEQARPEGGLRRETDRQLQGPLRRRGRWTTEVGLMEVRPRSPSTKI